MVETPIQFKHSQSSWEGVERRSNPLQDDPHHIVSQLEGYIDDKLESNKHEHRAYFDSRFDEVITLIKDGFPGGDPRGHREVHEGYIAEAKTKKEWRDAVVKQVLTGSVWATLLFIAGIVWTGIKAEVKR